MDKEIVTKINQHKLKMEEHRIIRHRITRIETTQTDRVLREIMVHQMHQREMLSQKKKQELETKQKM